MSSIIRADTIQDLSGNNIINESGNTITIGASGDTTNIVGTLQNNGASVGGDNTPAFYVTSNSANSLTSGAYSKVNFDTEQVDTDSAYDTSSYRFTVPSGEGGKYWISASWGADSGNDTDKISVFIKKNNSSFLFGMTAVNKAYNSTNVSGMAVLSAGDYIEVFAYQDSGTTYNINTDGTFTFFMGYKLIGV